MLFNCKRESNYCVYIFFYVKSANDHVIHCSEKKPAIFSSVIKQLWVSGCTCSVLF